MRKILVLTLASLALPSVAASSEIDCNDPLNTVEINHCAQREVDAAQAELTKYFQASLDQHADDPTLITALRTAQHAWEAFASAHCDAIYTQWRGGTIRALMALSCREQLTRARTHKLWQAFLADMDGNADLPEPPQPKQP